MSRIRSKKKQLEQDNQSTIKLLKNGRTFAGKQSQHIAIRYFWIVDRLKKEQVEIEYCPTGIMLGDFFTKPLQGSLFKKMQDVVMDLQPITILKTEKELKRKILSDQDAYAEFSNDFKNWINSKVPSPLLNRDKERVEKDNLKVNFANDYIQSKDRRKIRENEQII